MPVKFVYNAKHTCAKTRYSFHPFPLKCDFLVFEPAVQTQSVKWKSVLRLNGIKWVKFPCEPTPPPQFGNFFDEIPFSKVKKLEKNSEQY